MKEEEFLTVREVAKRLRMSEGWVYAHATKAEPRLPSVKIGGSLRFRKSKIDEWIAGLEREAA